MSKSNPDWLERGLKIDQEKASIIEENTSPDWVRNRRVGGQLLFDSLEAEEADPLVQFIRKELPQQVEILKVAWQIICSANGVSYEDRNFLKEALRFPEIRDVIRMASEHLKAGKAKVHVRKWNEVVYPPKPPS